MQKNEKQKEIERSPVVVVMGHIDHGKSTLLDYIRKTNVVAGEAGGITQHMSAYEVVHKAKDGATKKMTFLDTPGHEAFAEMRSRGAAAADIAVLVVSAEDSVKAQTIEAWNTIIESKTPYIVAINKIDKPNANVEKVKNDLLEKGIYLEGYGGDVPFVEISAKEGTNIEQLFDLILIVAEIAELKGDPSVGAEGIVIESHLDPKRGLSATLIIKNGTLKKSMFVVVDDALASTRLIEDFMGKKVESLSFSSPVGITGFDSQPKVGERFYAFANKKDAEQAVRIFKETTRNSAQTDKIEAREDLAIVPILIKTDVSGTGVAVVQEIKKLETDRVKMKIITRGVGAITENDVKMASGDKNTIVLGFNVKLEPRAKDHVENQGVTVATFDIIYKLTDYLKEIVEKRTPRTQVAETTGSVRILKIFSAAKDKMVVGARIESGKIALGNEARIMRRDFPIGSCKITNIEQHKMKVKEINDGECGMLVETKFELAPGDVLEAFTMVTK